MLKKVCRGSLKYNPDSQAKKMLKYFSGIPFAFVYVKHFLFAG